MVTRIVPDFVFQLGDAGSSIFGDYGTLFPDESFELKASGAGDLYMANLGTPNTNSDQFFIVTAKGETDLRTFVKIGRVIDGLDHIYFMERFGMHGGQVTKEIYVESCGEIETSQKK